MMRNDNRIIKFCRGCSRAWLCERGDFQGDVESFRKQFGRLPNRCSCSKKDNRLEMRSGCNEYTHQIAIVKQK